MSKLIKNSFGNFLVILVIFSLVTGWFFSGWPRISQNPPIPPKINKAAAASWYNASWAYRQAITLQGTKISTTTSAFPILATTTLDVLKAVTNGGHVANNSGFDIVFTDSDGTTLLNYEREKYASTTGEIAYWIKTGVASSTDKTIYMYYGNSGATDQATTTGVWDSNFKGVWHLKETDIDGGAGDIKDSTSNANNATTSGMDTSDQVTGQIDGSFDFDGSNDYVRNPKPSWDFTANPTLSHTVSAWFYPTYTGAPNYAGLGISQSGMSMRIMCVPDATYRWAYQIMAGSTYPRSNNGPCVMNTWQYVVGVYNAANTTIYVYYNGKEVASSTAANIDTSALNNYLYIGYNQYYFKGRIDEVRVSDISRDAGWIKTEYNNQSNVGTFMQFGSELTVPTVTTQDASSVTDTTATGNGNITATGGENATRRGFAYKVGTSGDPTTSDSVAYDDGSFGTGAYTKGLTDLTPGTSYRVRAYAVNSAGTGYGSTVQITTVSAATVSCNASPGSTSFGTLDTSSVFTSSPNTSTTMSCSGTASGCTLYVKDAGSGSDDGLWNSSASSLIESPTAANPSNATDTLSTNAEGYGIQAATTTAGSGATFGIPARYNVTGNVVGGLTRTNQTLASSTADTSNREVVVTHKAAVSANTFSGSYSDTITYECTVN